MKPFVLFTGMREWRDETRVRARLQTYKPGEVIILHGDCPEGLDAIVDRLAKEMGFEVKPMAADWDTYGLAAGHIRNKEMVDLDPIACHCYFAAAGRDPERFRKSGTRNCRAMAKNSRIPTSEEWEDEPHGS